MIASLGVEFRTGQTVGTDIPIERVEADYDIIFLGLGGVAVYWSTVRLKYVRMDDRFLYVSNGLREIEVPLRDVTGVTYNRWTRTHLVTLEFAHDTEFGERIVFMPSVRAFAFWSVHPVVAEIEAAVAMATGRRLSSE